MSADPELLGALREIRDAINSRAGSICGELGRIIYNIQRITANTQAIREHLERSVSVPPAQAQEPEPKNQLRIVLRTMGLKVGAAGFRSLEKLNIQYLDELAEHTYPEIRGLSYIGSVALADLHRALRSHGLEFKEGGWK